MSYKLAPLVVKPGPKIGTASQIFLSQPDQEQNDLAGRLFLLAEFESKKADDLKLLDFIIEEANRHYYQNSKLLIIESGGGLETDKLFELAVAKLNRSLSVFLQNKKLKPQLENVSLTLGAIVGNRLNLANFGRNRALLVYKPKIEINNQLEGFEILNILASGNNEAGLLNLNKLFDNVVNGRIPDNGALLLANETLAEYLSDKQLVSIITALPPAGTAEQIKNIVEQTNNHGTFLAVVVKQSIGGDKDEKRPPAILKPMPERRGSLNHTAGGDADSVRHLNLTEERTEKILNPATLGGFGAVIARLNPFALSRGRNKIMKQPEASGSSLAGWRKTSSNKKNLAKSIGDAALLLLSGVVMIVNGLVHILSNLPQAFSQIKNWRANFSQVGLAIKSAGSKRVRKLFQLSARSKILLLVGCVCLLILAGNIIYSSISKARAEAQAAYQNNLSQTESQLNQAEASLVFHNIDGARTQLIAAKQSLNNWPQKQSKAQQVDWQKDNARYLKDYNEAFNILSVNNPTAVIDLTKLNQNFSALSLVNGQLILSNAQTIYKITDGQAAAVADANSLIKNLTWPAVDGSYLYFYNQDAMLRFDPAIDQLTAMNIAGTVASSSVITVFNNRLFAFDPTSGQVDRWIKTGAGFTSEKLWLKVPADLSNISSVSIDGQVYLAQGKQIKEYNLGQPMFFQPDQIDPAIANIEQIIVSQNNNYLYALDKQNSRLLIFDKAGKYLWEYQADCLGQAKAVQIDEDKKIVYCLADNALYSWPATHMNQKAAK